MKLIPYGKKPNSFVFNSYSSNYWMRSLFNVILPFLFHLDRLLISQCVYRFSYVSSPLLTNQFCFRFMAFYELNFLLHIHGQLRLDLNIYCLKSRNSSLDFHIMKGPVFNCSVFSSCDGAISDLDF